MRLDKFLKITRIIKRRTIAQQLCDSDNVLVNGKAQKPSYSIKKCDELVVKYFNNTIKAKVLEIPKESLKKEEIGDYVSFEN